MGYFKKKSGLAQSPVQIHGDGAWAGLKQSRYARGQSLFSIRGQCHADLVIAGGDFSI